MAEETVNTQALVIKSLAHDGYRRAGMAFKPGENTVPAGSVTAAQLAMLEADPRLAILGEPGEVAQTSAADGTPGAVVQGHLPDGVTEQEVALQLEIMAAIARLDPENQAHFTSSNKPQVEALTQLLGKPVTAAERDDAWSSYQHSQAEEQPE